MVTTKKAIGFIGRISENVEGGLQQRKVDLKTVKQHARPSNRRCIVAVFREYMRCIPSSVEDFSESLFRAERQVDVRYGVQTVGINSLSKYLKSMCTEAEINMD